MRQRCSYHGTFPRSFGSARTRSGRSSAVLSWSHFGSAAILTDAAAGLVARTPALQPLVTVESERVVGPNGAWVRVLTQPDSGAWGLRDAHLLVLDEFAQRPDARGARRSTRRSVRPSRRSPADSW